MIQIKPALGAMLFSASPIEVKERVLGAQHPSASVVFFYATLADAETDKHLADRARKLAKMSESIFAQPRREASLSTGVTVTSFPPRPSRGLG